MKAAAAANAFPWDEVLAAGLGQLRLAPDDFWAMTPRELGAALGFGNRKGQTMTRAEFDALRQQCPADTNRDERMTL